MFATAHSLRWADSSQTRVFLFTYLNGEEIPMIVSADYDTEAGRDLYMRAIAGEFGSIAPYVPQAKTKEQLKAEIDAQRDAKLAAGLKVGDNTFHTDVVFQSQLQAFLLAWETGILQPTQTVAIRTKENAILQMTQADVKQLASQIMAYVQQVYAESWAAKDNLG